MPRDDTIQIPIGQRLRAQDGTLWEITRIAPVIDNVTHVNLVSAYDDTVTKILSVDAIFDKRLFRPVEG